MIFPFSHKIIVEFLTYLERRQQNKSKFFFFFFLHCETSSPQGRKLRKEVATRYMPPTKPSKQPGFSPALSLFLTWFPRLDAYRWVESEARLAFPQYKIDMMCLKKTFLKYLFSHEVSQYSPSVWAAAWAKPAPPLLLRLSIILFLGLPSLPPPPLRDPSPLFSEEEGNRWMRLRWLLLLLLLLLFRRLKSLAWVWGGKRRRRRRIGCLPAPIFGLSWRRRRD